MGACALFVLAAFTTQTPFLKEVGYLETNVIIFIFGAVVSAVFKGCDENRRAEQFMLRKELEEKNIAMQQELELAKQVHRSLIPKSFSDDKVEIAVSYLPYFYVGGDYARFDFLDKDRLLIFIMDITGHGVSAALLVNRLHTEIGNLARKFSQPGDILKELDLFVQKSFEDTHKFLTACACVVDFKEKRLFYSNFGHPPQILYQGSTKEIQWLSSQHHMLGIATSPTEKMYETELKFNKGDHILLFTDGVLEVQGRDKEMFGGKRLEKFIQEKGDLSPEVFNQSLLERLDQFKTKPISDDIFLLNIQIKK